MLYYDNRSQSKWCDRHTPSTDTQKITKWVLFLYKKHPTVWAVGKRCNRRMPENRVTPGTPTTAASPLLSWPVFLVQHISLYPWPCVNLGLDKTETWTWTHTHTHTHTQAHRRRSSERGRGERVRWRRLAGGPTGRPPPRWSRSWCCT